MGIKAWKVLFTLCITFVIGYLFISKLIAENNPNPPTTSSIFMEEVPYTLTKEINGFIDYANDKFPMTNEETKHTNELIVSYDEKDDDIHDATLKYFRSLEIKSIPSIGEMLLSENENIRVNSILLLDYLILIPFKKNDDFQKWFTAVCERALLDKSIKVRKQAVNSLYSEKFNIAITAVRTTEALKRAALSDPDADIRQLAQDFLRGYSIDKKGRKVIIN